MVLEDWLGGRGLDLEFRRVPGGALVQTPDLKFPAPETFAS